MRKLSYRKKKKKITLQVEERETGRNLPEEEEIQQRSPKENNPSGNEVQFS